MNNAAHTPGPWHIAESQSNGDDLISVDSESRHITLHTLELPEDLANARLIAAAPELLSALVEVMDNTGAISLVNNKFAKALRARAVAAINKATGQS